MTLNSSTRLESNSLLAFNFEELNEELKINNERIYKLAHSLLEQKIDVDTAAPIINEFRARNEYLRQVIGDMYENSNIRNQLVDCQSEEVTFHNSSTGHNESGQLCPLEQEYSSGSSSGVMTPPLNRQNARETVSENRKLRPRTRVVYTGMDGGEDESRSRSPVRVTNTSSSTSTRVCRFRSVEKVSLDQARARGFTKLVSIDDHVKLHGKVLIMVKLYSNLNKEETFVLSCVDAFDADKIMLKNYLDSVDGKRGVNLMEGTMEPLKYIRNNHISTLSRDVLVEIEKSEFRDYMNRQREHNRLIASTNRKTQAVVQRTPQRQRLSTITSTSKSLSHKNWRDKLFITCQKMTRIEAQAKGYTRLVRVQDHYRLQGKTLILVTLQKENSHSSDDEITLALSLLDAYDYDKYSLKNYVDSVTGIREGNILSNQFKQLNLIRQSNIDELDRNDLVDLERIELLKAKRRSVSHRELRSISTRTGHNSSEVICIDSDSDSNVMENDITDPAPGISTQASSPISTFNLVDQKPFISATVSSEAPSPLMEHLIIN